jgi:hypothetical protein
MGHRLVGRAADSPESRTLQAGQRGANHPRSICFRSASPASLRYKVERRTAPVRSRLGVRGHCQVLRVEPHMTAAKRTLEWLGPLRCSKNAPGAGPPAATARLATGPQQPAHGGWACTGPVLRAESVKVPQSRLLYSLASDKLGRFNIIAACLLFVPRDFFTLPLCLSWARVASPYFS